MNDTDLVTGLRDKDPEAVRYLTQYYLPSIWRFVYVRVKGDRHLAEDILSETVLELIRAAESGTTIDKPSAWMRSVANRKSVDHFRAAARVRHLVQQVTRTEATAEHDDAVTLQLRIERREEVRRVMDGLSEQHRIALEWKYIEKLSVREIAQRWDTTEKAAESILFRARREFRKQFRKQSKDNPRPIIDRPADSTLPHNHQDESRENENVEEPVSGSSHANERGFD